MEIIITNLKPDTNCDSGGDREVKYASLVLPMGLGIIAEVLRANNYAFQVYDSYVNGTTEGFLEKIEKEKPSFILLSAFLGNYMYSFLKDISYQIKAAYQSVTIILGGPIAGAIPELLITKTAIDFIVTGEGEVTIIELLDSLKKKKDVSSVKGIYFKGASKKAVFTGQRQRLVNLDRSPRPLYEGFPVKAYIDFLNRTGRCWELVSSRGCPYACEFCCRLFGRNITYYSLANIINYMSEVKRNYGIDRFSFDDDNFLIDPKRVHEFRNMLADMPHKFKWRFQGRADSISPKMVEDLLKVGMFDISFGLESGSQEMLRRYGKTLDINKASDNLMAIREMVDFHATFIVGGPQEDWNTIKETEALIKKLRLKNCNIGFLTLLPKTALYNDALKSGLIKDEDEYCMNLGPFPCFRLYTNISNLSDEDLIKARELLVNTASQFGAYE